MFEPYLVKRSIISKEIYLAEGKICRDMGFINSGAFRMYYLSDGKEINLHFSLEDDFVVEYDSFLEQKPSRYYIQALEESEIVIFNLEVLQKAYHKSHNWERFGRLMAENAYKMMARRTESFLFLNGEQRYTALLQNNPHIFERISLYHIASYLGMERESLSRLRRKLAGK